MTVRQAALALLVPVALTVLSIPPGLAYTVEQPVPVIVIVAQTPPPSPLPVAATPPRDGYDTEAAALNIVRPPLKAGLCALGVVAGVVVTAITLGAAQHTAAETIHDGCGGPWQLTGADLRPTNPLEDLSNLRTTGRLNGWADPGR